MISNPNIVIPFNNTAGDPDNSYLPLQRCQGDCDSDNDCDAGLFCMENYAMEPVPGCNDTRNSGWDYCVDINDFDVRFTWLPTGSWNSPNPDDRGDWHYSKPLAVNLTGE